MSKEGWIPCKAETCEIHSQFIRNGEGQIGYPETMREHCVICTNFVRMDLSGQKIKELNLRGRF
jgi:hypothetical protein